ncbi:MAG: Type II secretion system protein G precursor [Lentisphaerae bacterium ADurb.BinA184]|nr:MAG: Type II secretion system protein G precursor [Lentisphaerae bacterium ADurb.BinA184]
MRRDGFTLIELLVVVAIIAILSALLLPGLGRARDKGLVTVCAGRQRQMAVALGNYAGDAGEYPTNYSNGTTAASWNWGDECSGRWFGAPPATAWNSTYEPDGSDAFPDVAGKQAGAWHRLAAGEYVTHSQGNPAGISLCPGRLPPGWVYGSNMSTRGLYVYNGPHTYRLTIGNNGSSSGLYRLGRHHQGVDWGVRYQGDNPSSYSWSQIAFLTCPSMYLTASSLLREPHGCRPVASYAGVGYGNGQADWGFVGANPDVFHYDRNYLYGDGHVAYLTSPLRAGIPP